MFPHKGYFCQIMVCNNISGYFSVGNLFFFFLIISGCDWTGEGDLCGAYVNNGVLIILRKHVRCLIFVSVPECSVL